MNRKLRRRSPQRRRTRDAEWLQERGVWHDTWGDAGDDHGEEDQRLRAPSESGSRDPAHRDLSQFGQKDRPAGTETQALIGTNGPELLTVEQTADVLQIGRDRVYRLLRIRELPSIKIGKLRRISRQRIADFIRQRES